MQRQSQNKIRPILGITGSFGSGKSTVAKMFALHGARLIDADKIAHNVIKPGNIAYKKIIVGFGKGILDKNSRIDRKMLARIVFNDKKLLQKLNKIVHPQIIGIIKKQIKNAGAKAIILDAPLLIEAGLKGLVDKIIVVKISKEKQIRRLIKNTSLGRVDILKRIRSQVPLHVKSRFADFIIDNSGTIEETKRQVNEICKKLGLSLVTGSKRQLLGINSPLRNVGAH